ncbi:unnamed protein product [Dicrocoelium dendriticum]|nr:unnamed protein product [Dicrocoelium dendriticum]
MLLPLADTLAIRSGVHGVPLVRRIEAELPEATVTTRVSVRDSLEIKYNGFLIFSKLELGGFPNIERVMENLRHCVAGFPPAKMTESERYFYCSVL